MGTGTGKSDGKSAEERTQTTEMASTSKSSKNPTNHVSQAERQLSGSIRASNNTSNSSQNATSASGILQKDAASSKESSVARSGDSRDVSVSKSSHAQEEKPVDPSSKHASKDYDKKNTSPPSITKNTGFDQVSVDVPHEPLVASKGETSKQSIPSESLPPASSMRPAAPTPAAAASAISKKPSTDSISSRPLSAAAPPSTTEQTKDSAPSSSFAMDEQTLLEEKLKAERAPLTEKYGSFVEGSDTCLEDARRRLHTALEQTRQLRHAFTERVYNKYRVCLVPPLSTAQTLTNILTDPAKVSKELEQQMERLNAEKLVEKKEASKLNTEVMMVTGGVSPTSAAAAPASGSSSTASNATAAPGLSAAPTGGGSAAATPVPSNTENDRSSSTTATAPASSGKSTNPSSMNPLEVMNAENADQLMYVSAGLSLIVLPEQQDLQGMDLSRYRYRSPTDPATGQRVKGISAAAAAAGEVMLDRSRKAAALLAERKRRRSSEFDYHNYSRLEFLSKHPTNPPPTPAPPPATIDTGKSKKGGALPSNEASGRSKSLAASTLETANLKKPPPSAAATTDSGLSTASKGSASAAASTVRMAKASSAATASRRPASKQSPSTSSSPIPSAAAKAIRARVQATMSVQTLLSLSPSGEELRSDGKYSAATLALIERGVGTQGQQFNKAHPHHQRFRHPYPESQGAHRRALQQQNTAAIRQDPLTHPAYMALSLPPLPTAKERRTRKRLSTIKKGAGNDRAKEAMRKVLQQFDGKIATETRPRKRRRTVTEIGFMHGIQNFEKKAQDDETKASDMDPMLAFHVMQAVGLIQPSSIENSKKQEPIFPENLDTSMFSVAEKRAIGDEGGVSRRSIHRLQKLHQKFTSSSYPKSFCDCVLEASTPMDIDENSTAADGILPSSLDSVVPVVPIRGGGEALNESSESGSRESSASAPGNVNSAAVAAAAPSKHVTDYSENSVKISTKSNQAAGARAESQQTQASPGQTNVWDPSRLVLMNPGIARRPGHMSASEHFHPNAIQLANQLRISRMHSAHHGTGDFAEYLGGLHSQPASGYSWSAAAASAQSLAALGLNPQRGAMVNYSLQDRTRAMLRDQNAAAAAHAAAHRQQQALAYLSSGRGYTSNGTHLHHMAGSGMGSTLIGQGSTAVAPVSMLSQQAPRCSSKQGNNVAESAGKKSTKDDAKQTSQKRNSDDADQIVEDSSSASGSGPKSADNDVAAWKESRTKRKATDESPAVRPGKKIKADDVGPALSVESKQEGFLEGHEKVAPESVPELRAVPERTAQLYDKPQASKPLEMNEVKSTKIADTNSNGSPKGLQFVVPPAPSDVPTNIAANVLNTQSYEAVDLAGTLSLSEKSSLVGYFVVVGTAVPIPKALVAGLLKDKLNAPSLKTSLLNNIPQSSRDAAVATILIWLWKNHENCFQQAFAKSGRIDVEPECKWLITTTVEKAVGALSNAIEDNKSRSSSPLAIALMAIKSKGPAGSKGSQNKDTERFVTATLDLLVVSTVSRGLAAGLQINVQTDAFLHSFNDLLEYLDETRKGALHSKSQERALLAALISRKATMSLSFSHAYVSAMVRAGEALGHGDLFEVVQNEEVNVSTMIPYDVFTDESGAWEDPCRPVNGFNANLIGDDLMRQAHARAMIQKSLKKLQDRHNIRGGTPVPGAYTDPPTVASSDSGKTLSSSGVTTPRGWYKRRSSFSEPPVQPGTGSAAATSWSLYDPKHYSAPLPWKPDKLENTPYGKHNSSTRPRSLSLSQFNLKFPGGARGKRSPSGSSMDPKKMQEPDNGPMRRSTREIPWVDVARIFQSVTIPGTPKLPDIPSTPRGRTIFAPFVREVGFEDVAADSTESDDEEDLRDESVLARHQVVLDRMKGHLSAFLEARQKAQDKKKSRTG